MRMNSKKSLTSNDEEGIEEVPVEDNKDDDDLPSKVMIK